MTDYLNNSEQIPRKRVFISYKYRDSPRFDLVRKIASRLRFFSFDVVLDQRALDFGADIRGFMKQSIDSADAMIVLISEDYNQALQSSAETGAGIRFELDVAMSKAKRQQEFQIIPILLDDARPVYPFDGMMCATSDAIDEIATQLYLQNSTHLAAESRTVNNRYRIDQLLEQRGITSIFSGYDPVADLPIEIYSFPFVSGDRPYSYDQFERVVHGRTSTFSPFLLNIRDTFVDHNAGFFIITESFPGRDLQTYLGRGLTTHPFGALLVGYQLALALNELHNVQFIHGGLAARCVRLSSDQTKCKIVDFEFAEAMGSSLHDAEFAGYPLITPPERFDGAPPSVLQDIYQLGNLIFQLVVGRPVVAAEYRRRFPWPGPSTGIFLDSGNLFEGIHKILKEKLNGGVQFEFSTDEWTSNKIRISLQDRFVAKSLAPLISRCLDPNPDRRPRSVSEVIDTIAGFGIPCSGYPINPDGEQIANSLFSQVNSG